MRITLNSAGDTIVEVLIAMAVLGAVLTGGYAIATSSLNGVRVSQERNEALKVAETQAEALRVQTGKITDRVVQASQLKELIISDNAATPYPEPNGNNAFCMKATGDGTVKVKIANPASPTSFDPACKVGNGYNVVITNKLTHLEPSKPDGGPLQVIYNINVYWDRSGGGVQQTLNLPYKVVI